MKEFFLQRSEKMKALRAAGSSLQEIGDLFGISRERVRMVIDSMPRPDSSLALLNEWQSAGGPKVKRLRKKWAAERLAHPPALDYKSGIKASMMRRKRAEEAILEFLANKEPVPVEYYRRLDDALFEIEQISSRPIKKAMKSSKS